jgi:signal transduction histidine kinase
LSAPASGPDAWLDDLAEGVVAVEGGRVVRINRAAVAMLEVDGERSVGLPLIAVLRDHRLEQAFFEQRSVELRARGRTLAAQPTSWGLLLRDVSDVRSSQAGSRELLAVLSHELRTPVTTIRSVLEALRLDLSPERRDRFLEQAEAESVRLTRLLEDLTVDVAPPRARSVDLRDAVDRAAAVVRSTLNAHGVTLDTAAVTGTVWADPDKVLQVIVNLVENAAIHGPDHAEIVLSVRAEPDRADRLVLEVADRGAPLDPDRIEELFEPHARGASAKAKGTGLGLYIVRSIAERWGGRAWGRSDVEGNAFAVSAPDRRPP